MTENRLGITEKYSREIQNIGNKLKDLEMGRVYELSQSRMDGFLATNIGQLRKMISELITKIDNKQPSINDQLTSIFEKEKD